MLTPQLKSSKHKANAPTCERTFDMAKKRSVSTLRREVAGKLVLVLHNTAAMALWGTEILEREHEHFRELTSSGTYNAPEAFGYKDMARQLKKSNKTLLKNIAKTTEYAMYNPDGAIDWTYLDRSLTAQLKIIYSLKKDFERLIKKRGELNGRLRVSSKKASGSRGTSKTASD
jgi:hypothetical protein